MHGLLNEKGNRSGDGDKTVSWPVSFGEHAYYLAATDNDKFVSTDEL